MHVQTHLRGQGGQIQSQEVLDALFCLHKHIGKKCAALFWIRSCDRCEKPFLGLLSKISLPNVAAQEYSSPKKNLATLLLGHPDQPKPY